MYGASSPVQFEDPSNEANRILAKQTPVDRWAPDIASNSPIGRLDRNEPRQITHFGVPYDFSAFDTNFDPSGDLKEMVMANGFNGVRFVAGVEQAKVIETNSGERILELSYDIQDQPTRITQILYGQSDDVQRAQVNELRELTSQVSDSDRGVGSWIAKQTQKAVEQLTGGIIDPNKIDFGKVVSTETVPRSFNEEFVETRAPPVTSQQAGEIDFSDLRMSSLDFKVTQPQSPVTTAPASIPATIIPANTMPAQAPTASSPVVSDQEAQRLAMLVKSPIINERTREEYKGILASRGPGTRAAPVMNSPSTRTEDLALPVAGERIDRGLGNNSLGVTYYNGPSNKFPAGTAMKQLDSSIRTQKEFTNLVLMAQVKDFVKPAALSRDSIELEYVAESVPLEEILNGNAPMPPGRDLRRELKALLVQISEQSRARVGDEELIAAAIQNNGGRLSGDQVDQVQQKIAELPVDPGKVWYPHDMNPKNILVTPTGLRMIDPGSVLMKSHKLDLLASWNKYYAPDGQVIKKLGALESIASANTPDIKYGEPTSITPIEVGRASSPVFERQTSSPSASPRTGGEQASLTASSPVRQPDPSRIPMYRSGTVLSGLKNYVSRPLTGGEESINFYVPITQSMFTKAEISDVEIGGIHLVDANNPEVVKWTHGDNKLVDRNSIVLINDMEKARLAGELNGNKNMNYVPFSGTAMLRMIRADVRGKVVVDVGAGTGMLSLAALKSGAKKVVLIEYEPNFVADARKNFELNGRYDDDGNFTAFVEGKDFVILPAESSDLTNPQKVAEVLHDSELLRDENVMMVSNIGGDHEGLYPVTNRETVKLIRSLQQLSGQVSPSVVVQDVVFGGYDTNVHAGILQENLDSLKALGYEAGAQKTSLTWHDPMANEDGEILAISTRLAGTAASSPARASYAMPEKVEPLSYARPAEYGRPAIKGAASSPIRVYYDTSHRNATQQLTRMKTVLNGMKANDILALEIPAEHHRTFQMVANGQLGLTLAMRDFTEQVYLPSYRAILEAIETHRSESGFNENQGITIVALDPRTDEVEQESVISEKAEMLRLRGLNDFERGKYSEAVDSWSAYVKNSEPLNRVRESRFAKVISDAVRENPGADVRVVMGGFHVAVEDALRNQGLNIERGDNTDPRMVFEPTHRLRRQWNDVSGVDENTFRPRVGPALAETVLRKINPGVLAEGMLYKEITEVVSALNEADVRSFSGHLALVQSGSEQDLARAGIDWLYQKGKLTNAIMLASLRSSSVSSPVTALMRPLNNVPVSEFIKWAYEIQDRSARISGTGELDAIAQSMGISPTERDRIYNNAVHRARAAYTFAQDLPNDGKRNVYLMRDAISLALAERLLGGAPHAMYLSKSTFKKVSQIANADLIIPMMIGEAQARANSSGQSGFSALRQEFFNVFDEIVADRPPAAGVTPSTLRNLYDPEVKRKLKDSVKYLSGYLDQIGVTDSQLAQNGVRFIDTTMTGSFPLFMEGVARHKLQQRGDQRPEDINGKTGSRMFYSQLSRDMMSNKVIEAGFAPRQVEFLYYPVDFNGEFADTGEPMIKEGASARARFEMMAYMSALSDRHSRESQSTSSPVEPNDGRKITLRASVMPAPDIIMTRDQKMAELGELSQIAFGEGKVDLSGAVERLGLDTVLSTVSASLKYDAIGGAGQVNTPEARKKFITDLFDIEEQKLQGVVERGEFKKVIAPKGAEEVVRIYADDPARSLKLQVNGLSEAGIAGKINKAYERNNDFGATGPIVVDVRDIVGQPVDIAKTVIPLDEAMERIGALDVMLIENLKRAQLSNPAYNFEGATDVTAERNFGLAPWEKSDGSKWVNVVLTDIDGMIRGCKKRRYSVFDSRMLRNISPRSGSWLFRIPRHIAPRPPHRYPLAGESSSKGPPRLPAGQSELPLPENSVMSI
jgi:hypothetical protein